MSSDYLEGDLNQDGIIDEMDRVRGDLDGQINELGASVRNMFDWQAYVRAAPLTSVGAAVVVGILLAPRIFSKSAIVAAAPAPLGSASPTSSGIAQSLFGMVIAGAARAGSVYVADLLARNFTSSPDPQSATDSSEPTFDMGV